MKSKENFIGILNSIKLQLEIDKQFAKELGQVLGAETNPYNNSLLYNALVDIMAGWFNNPEASKEEINRFIHELDFNSASQMSDSWNYEALWNTLSFDVLLTAEQMADKLKKAKESKDEIFIPNAMHNSDIFGNYFDRKRSLEKVEDKLFKSQAMDISEYYDVKILVDEIKTGPLDLLQFAIVKNRIYKAVKSMCDGTYKSNPKFWNFEGRKGEPYMVIKKILEEITREKL